MQRPLGAQISHMLKDRGVDVVFGIPGVHNQEMYRGIEEAGITHVLARHEQGAGFMADGYARATGKPGVAYVITGPGLCNILTPMGQATSDSVPVLVISSCLDDVSAQRGQLHQMKDQRAAAATVCDWSEEVCAPSAVYKLIDRAFVEFETRRPSAKHIQVPIAALQAMAPLAWHADPLALPERPQMSQAVLDQAVAALKTARKPLFVFGGGARGAAEFANEVLTATGAAAFCTYAGRGIVPGDSPTYLGSTLARPETARLCAEADLVVTIGTELAEVDLWRDKLGHSCDHISVDIDPEVLAAREGPGFGVLSDASAFLRAVSAALQGHAADSDWSVERLSALRSQWRAETDAERPGIVAICDALQTAVPQDTMIYSDMTQFAYVAKEVWDMPAPGLWHHPYGFGTLGYATPAAIGGAIARKGAPTLAIIGDYGFHYTMAELGVAVELGLPLPIILWDNGKLKEIEDSMVRSQIAPNAVAARNPDFCRLAEAFGAFAVAPPTLAQMQTAVRDAFDADRPTLIYLTPDA
ncbi:MAG: 5-guanidino-2-oxopentanoate decarboxylase [Roseobacter sp.]